MLLLGGRNKGSDFKPLALEAAQRSRAVILFGEAAPELAAAFAHVEHDVRRVDTMADAVELAAQVAAPGDAVVLSPACASYDEFKNYEERGRVFKSLVASMGEVQ